MVIYENYGENGLGVSLTRAYSDSGYYIEREDCLYEEAVDPTELNREYTETEELIPTDSIYDELIAEVKGDD